MAYLFCLMGKSSTGKDTILAHLKTDKTLSLRPVIPYTTRPKRSHETDGEAYRFITRQELCRWEKLGQVIERRIYNTVQGDWHYCTLDDGQIDFSKASYIMITVPSAFLALKARFGEDNVIPLYIYANDYDRLLRAINREKKEESPDYTELCRRFVADSQDFSENILTELGIKKTYLNDCLSKCVLELKKDIRHIINK